MRRTLSMGTLCLGVALVVSTSVLVSTPAMSRSERKAAAESSLISWEISGAKVANPGQTSTTREGTLTKGYTLVGTATSASGSAPINKGTFKLTLSLFAPAQDMPGQQAGNWYLQGDWSITDDRASMERKKARHSVATIQGRISATLPFNPAMTPGEVDAVVKLPMSLAAGRWSSGQGSFNGNEKFEGLLALSTELRPDVAKRKGMQR